MEHNHQALSSSKHIQESNPAKSDDLLNLLKPSIVLQVTLVMDRGIAQLKEETENKPFGASKHAGRL